MTDRVAQRTSALAADSSRQRHRRRGVVGRFLEPLFGRVLVETTVLEHLRSAHEKGVVVHTLRSSRLVDPLYIQYLLEQVGLPLPQWHHDHFLSEHPSTAAALCETVSRGDPSLLFLRRPQTLWGPSPRYDERFVQSLLELQQRSETPILLLPEALVWRRRAADIQRSFVDRVFGDREEPGQSREVMGFMLHHRNARYYAGAPIDLQDALRREAGQPLRTVAKKVRWLILNHLAREEQLRTGPPHRPASRTRQSVLNDPDVRRVIESVAAKKGGLARVEAKADAMLKNIAADLRYGWLRVLDVAVDLIWSRIYDGIIVDKEGFARLRAAARAGPVVVVPSHKSHVDYMVLSQVFFKEGMVPPHIAAGENLNFWPMGTVFRRSGAFFIRRSFRGDKLYTAVFSGYVRRLLREGHVIEFFIEGGRSRTGKLLPPRVGMLGICMEPVLDGHLPDVTFVPVSIGYEKVIEAKAYAKELAGEKKKKEDVRSLLSSGPKVLRSRYGRVYVDFDQPISLQEFASGRGFDLSQLGSDEATRDRKQLAIQLGHRIVYGINHATRVTPSSMVALVLLARGQSGIAQGDLFAAVDRMLDFLDGLDTRISGALDPTHRQAALREAVDRFTGDGSVRTTVAPDGETIVQLEPSARQALDFYKNNILHFFVPYSVVAMALLAEGKEATDARMRDRARRISQVLKGEVTFRVDGTFDENFDAATSKLLARGGIVRSEDGWSVGDAGELRQLAGLVASVFECYRLTAESLDRLHDEPVPQKELSRRVLHAAQRQVLEGRIARPESVTQAGVDGAVHWLLQAGILTRVEGRLQVADEPQRVGLIDELTDYLRRLMP
jgi:glycerol-3-phosphate O-acyltransferase